jgi:hypothetical protein
MFDPKRLRETIDKDAMATQAYRMDISAAGIQIAAGGHAGIFYAHQTLNQLRLLEGELLPCLRMEDSPDYPARGVMLDVSRDKVPTMATLFSLIDLLAGWKINQLQLYIEHTFAYRNHADVWRDASPLTASEIRELDRYCRDRFIELVPNQNSFGHMERWLKHPRYLPLAEAPQGAPTPWGYFWEGPFSLCPTDPRCIDLLSELYEEVLPNFSSGLFNVGCDETFDIGHGRSAEICAKIGKQQVYLDFLKRVHALVRRHGRKMLFWGDIILSHPELIAELPDAIGLVWGYEANSPLDEHCAAFARSRVPFYVCPGTSSWCSLTGRTDNMLANARSAASAGLANGAIGYLMTDWGDHGHLQYLPISYGGFAAGAAFSWCLESNRQLDLPALLNAHIFADEAAIMGKLVCDLGNVYKASREPIANSTRLFRILVPPPTPKVPAAGMMLDELDASERRIDLAIATLPNTQMRCSDADLISAEMRNAAAMLRHACRIGRAELSGEAWERDGMVQIAEEHRRLWLARNRPGGLADSVRRLEAR